MSKVAENLYCKYHSTDTIIPMYRKCIHMGTNIYRILLISDFRQKVYSDETCLQNNNNYVVEGEKIFFLKKIFR